MEKSLLLAGNDIPFPEAQLVIHNPIYKEIALIGEEKFLIGVKAIIIDKNDLFFKGKEGLEDKDNFDIFMSIVERKKEIKESVLAVFSLFFIGYNIKFTEQEIILFSKQNLCRINAMNFDFLQKSVSEICCLNDIQKMEGYNPADKRAAMIADKLQKAKQRKNKNNQKQDKLYYGKIVSILSIGLSIDLNIITHYTIYQLLTSYQRYQKKVIFDRDFQARMAGATNLDEVENWME